MSAIPKIPKITVRPISPPKYCNEPVTLTSFERWFIVNERELRRYWGDLSGGPVLDDFLLWTQCQYDIARIAADSALRDRLRHDAKDEPRQESLRDYQRREFD